MVHDRSHEPLLRAALLGELKDGDPRLAELSACPVCRRELDELKAVATALDSAAGVDEAPAPGDPAGEAAALAALTRLAAEEPYGAQAAARAPRIGPWILPAAAAAAVLAFLALRGLRQDGGGEPPLYIGDEAPPVLVEPLGEVDRYEVFRWSYDPDHPYGFHLRIYPADAPDALPLILVEDWPGTTWTPSDAQRALLPARIEWEVDVLDAHGEVSLTSSSSRAWLRSH